MNKGYVVLKNDYDKIVAAYDDLQQENQLLRNQLIAVKKESSTLGTEVQQVERVPEKWVVKISCGNEQSIAVLTPNEVKILEQKFLDKQEIEPEAGWTMADIIACAVIWRGIAVIKEEIEDEL